jgi:hypothetical protein
MQISWITPEYRDRIIKKFGDEVVNRLVDQWCTSCKHTVKGSLCIYSLLPITFKGGTCLLYENRCEECEKINHQNYCTYPGKSSKKEVSFCHYPHLGNPNPDLVKSAKSEEDD